jgi:hypothetical protein
MSNILLSLIPAGGFLAGADRGGGPGILVTLGRSEILSYGRLHEDFVGTLGG